MIRFSLPLGLALAALSLLAAGTPAHAGERPIQVEGRCFLDASDDFDPELSGTGEGDHLGRCGLLIRLDAYELFQDNLVPLNVRLRAANGSLLYAAVDLEFDPATGIIAGTITFTGGTGRFADAAGSASLLIVPETWDGIPRQGMPFYWALEGNIDY